MVNLLIAFRGTIEGNTSFLFFFRSFVPVYLDPEAGGQHRWTKAHVLHDGYMEVNGWMAERMMDEWQWILNTYMLAYEWWWQTNIARMNTTQIWQHYCTGWTLTYKHNSNQTLKSRNKPMTHCCTMQHHAVYIDNIYCSVKGIMMVRVRLRLKHHTNQLKSNIHIPLRSFS